MKIITPGWKRQTVKRVACGLRWNTYFPRVNPMNLFRLVSRKCSMSFSLHKHRQVVVTFWTDLRGQSPAATIPHVKELADSHSTHAHAHTSKHKSPALCISFLRSHQWHCCCLHVRICCSAFRSSPIQRHKGKHRWLKGSLKGGQMVFWSGTSD